MFRGFSSHLEYLKTREGLWDSLRFSGTGDYPDVWIALYLWKCWGSNSGFPYAKYVPQSLDPVPQPLYLDKRVTLDFNLRSDNL